MLTKAELPKSPTRNIQHLEKKEDKSLDKDLPIINLASSDSPKACAETKMLYELKNVPFNLYLESEQPLMDKIVRSFGKDSYFIIKNVSDKKLPLWQFYYINSNYVTSEINIDNIKGLRKILTDYYNQKKLPPVEIIKDKIIQSQQETWDKLSALLDNFDSTCLRIKALEKNNEHTTNEDELKKLQRKQGADEKEFEKLVKIMLVSFINKCSLSSKTNQPLLLEIIKHPALLKCLLVKQNLDMDVRGYFGRSVFHQIVVLDNQDIAKNLLQQVLDVMEPSSANVLMARTTDAIDSKSSEVKSDIAALPKGIAFFEALRNKKYHLAEMLLLFGSPKLKEYQPSYFHTLLIMIAKITVDKMNEAEQNDLECTPRDSSDYTQKMQNYFALTRILNAMDPRYKGSGYKVRVHFLCVGLLYDIEKYMETGLSASNINRKLPDHQKNVKSNSEQKDIHEKILKALVQLENIDWQDKSLEESHKLEMIKSLKPLLIKSFLKNFPKNIEKRIVDLSRKWQLSGKPKKTMALTWPKVVMVKLIKTIKTNNNLKTLAERHLALRFFLQTKREIYDRERAKINEYEQKINDTAKMVYIDNNTYADVKRKIEVLIDIGKEKEKLEFKLLNDQQTIQSAVNDFENALTPDDAKKLVNMIINNSTLIKNLNKLVKEIDFIKNTTEKLNIELQKSNDDWKEKKKAATSDDPYARPTSESRKAMENLVKAEENYIQIESSIKPLMKRGVFFLQLLKGMLARLGCNFNIVYLVDDKNFEVMLKTWKPEQLNSLLFIFSPSNKWKIYGVKHDGKEVEEKIINEGSPLDAMLKTINNRIDPHEDHDVIYLSDDKYFKVYLQAWKLAQPSSRLAIFSPLNKWKAFTINSGRELIERDLYQYDDMTPLLREYQLQKMNLKGLMHNVINKLPSETPKDLDIDGLIRCLKSHNLMDDVRLLREARIRLFNAEQQCDEFFFSDMLYGLSYYEFCNLLLNENRLFADSASSIFIQSLPEIIREEKLDEEFVKKFKETATLMTKTLPLALHNLQLNKKFIDTLKEKLNNVASLYGCQSSLFGPSKKPVMPAQSPYQSLDKTSGESKQTSSSFEGNGTQQGALTKFPLPPETLQLESKNLAMPTDNIFIAALIQNEPLLTSLFYDKARATVELINDNLTFYIMHETCYMNNLQRKVMFLYEAWRQSQKLPSFVQAPDRSLNHLLVFDKGFVLLPEIRKNDVNETLPYILKLYSNRLSNSRIYICIHMGKEKEAGHFATLVIQKINSGITYRYIDPLHDYTPGGNDNNANDEQLKQQFRIAISDVFPGENITDIQTSYRKQQQDVKREHRSECGMHNIFDSLYMLATNPSVDLSTMRASRQFNLPGINSSNNGGLDPDDALILANDYRKLCKKLWEQYQALENKPQANTYDVASLRI